MTYFEIHTTRVRHGLRHFQLQDQLMCMRSFKSTANLYYLPIPTGSQNFNAQTVNSEAIASAIITVCV